MTGRCRLCLHPLPGDGFCLNYVECNARCRIRLGIPEWQVPVERSREERTYTRRNGDGNE